MYYDSDAEYEARKHKIAEAVRKDWNKTGPKFSAKPISKFRHYFNVSKGYIKSLLIKEKQVVISTQIAASRSHSFRSAKAQRDRHLVLAKND